MTNNEKLEAINAFVHDIDCLEPINAMLNEINIFDILKLDRTEIRHSNILAWLLDPAASHGLGERFLKSMLMDIVDKSNLPLAKGISPIDIDLMDLSDVSIIREFPIAVQTKDGKKRQLDILIVNSRAKLVFLIENKIDSGEGEDQLKDYRDYILSTYGKDYRVILAYLTPNGQKPSDSNYWVSVDYGSVLDTLNRIYNLYKSNIPDRAQIYIEDYIKTIRRKIMTDTELEQIALNVYLKHKEALDEIFKYRPTRLGIVQKLIFDCFSDALKNNSDIISAEKAPTNQFWFVHNDILKKYGRHLKTPKSGLNSVVLFQVVNAAKDKSDKNDIQAISVKVMVAPYDNNYEIMRQEAIDAAISASNTDNAWIGKYKKGSDTDWRSLRSDVLIGENDIKTLADKIIRHEDLAEENAKAVMREAINNYLSTVVPNIVKALL